MSGVEKANLGTGIGGLALRQIIPLGVVFVCIFLLKDQIRTVNVPEIIDVVMNVSLVQWVGAIIATCASFWAIGRYDAVLHGVLETSVSTKHAKLSGAAAIATAQFAGFGVLTGALVRWRLLPNTSFIQALKLSLAVSVSFLAGWAVFTSLVVLWSATKSLPLELAAYAVLFTAFSGLALSLWQPRWLRVFPSIKAQFAILGLVILDTGFAAIALWILLPSGLNIGIEIFLMAFLLALGAGLVGGTPAGLGPFEVTLFTILPLAANSELLAATLAFRLTYHALPAILSTILLFKGQLAADRVTRSHQLNSAAFWNTRRAETGLRHQREFSSVKIGNSDALCARSGQAYVMISDPIDGNFSSASAQDFKALAKKFNLSAFHYKCGSKTAIIARKCGWSILAVTQELWLNPTKFQLAGPKCRQLRRMLRKAESAGISACEINPDLYQVELTKIATDWSTNHGGERGFSMGQFSTDYVRHQRVFVARKSNQIIAFITLHEVANEWTLDLMRHAQNIPAGTMHSLIICAINAAAATNCPRLSLASVASQTPLKSALMNKLRIRMDEMSGTTGLRRFKTCFAPHSETLYAAAPTKVSLLLGLWSVLRRVTQTTTISR